MAGNKPNPENWAAKFGAFVQGGIQNMIASSQPVDPPPSFAIPEILAQIQNEIQTSDDRSKPVRTTLLLAAILASQAGWTLKEALEASGVAWAQTAPLRPAKG